MHQRVLDILGFRIDPKVPATDPAQIRFPTAPAPAVSRRGLPDNRAQHLSRPVRNWQPEILHRQAPLPRQAGSAARLFLRAGVLLGHGHPCLTRQNLDRLHKAYVLGLAHQKRSQSLLANGNPDSNVESLRSSTWKLADFS